MGVWLGVAQLVARNVWDVEVAGSSPVTQTIFSMMEISGIGAVGSAHAWGA